MHCTMVRPFYILVLLLPYHSPLESATLVDSADLALQHYLDTPARTGPNMPKRTQSTSNAASLLLDVVDHFRRQTQAREDRGWLELRPNRSSTVYCALFVLLLPISSSIK